jgi:hypothetical protein
MERIKKTKVQKNDIHLQNNIWKKAKNVYMHALKIHVLFLWPSQKKKNMYLFVNNIRL